MPSRSGEDKTANNALDDVVIKMNVQAVRCCTVRLVLKEARWKLEDVVNIKGTPRCLAPSQGDSNEARVTLVAEEAGEARRTRTN